MKVEDTGKLGASFVSAYRGVIREKGTFFFGGQGLSFTYEDSRKAAMILRISVSLFVVSSNPGVSIKRIGCPSSRKMRDMCTAAVQDLRPSLTSRLDPLARFMNCSYQGRVSSFDDACQAEMNVR